MADQEYYSRALATFMFYCIADVLNCYFYFYSAPETHSVGLFKGTTSNPTKIVFAFYAALWAYDGW